MTVERAELEAADCWFVVDRVPRRPDVTEFKRRARLHQARWREAQGLPVGSHLSGRPRLSRTNGSRIELAEARSSRANLLSDRIRDAAGHRLGNPQPHETLDPDRLWSDLLSSMPMCFNLFGELHDDPDRLTAAAKAIWPDHPGQPETLEFEWSPGRRDPEYLGDRTAFDAAILLRTNDRSRGIIGIETKYHEHAIGERPPHPTARLPRYLEVSERSGIFKQGWKDEVIGTDLQQIWRDHLLVLAMLQHRSKTWSWGRYVLVYPAGNPSCAEAGVRYAELLNDHTTFEVRTVEDLLDTRVLHPEKVEAAFRRRYLC